MNDENIMLNNVLAGNIDFTAQLGLNFEQVQVLRRDWEPQKKGAIVPSATTLLLLSVQFRPEYLEELALADLRVRRALAHTLNRQGLNEGLFDGTGIMSEGTIVPGNREYEEAERTVTKYPFDPRRAEQLMGEAGFTKDSQGLFARANGVRFSSDLKVTGGPEFERAQAILADSWRRDGFDMRSSVVPAAQARDSQARHTFPALASRGGGTDERTWITSEIGTATNRWLTSNRGGWSNPDYDRLHEAFSRTLDANERSRQRIQMQAILADQRPMYVLYWQLYFNTYITALSGPSPKTVGSSQQGATLPYWNVHEWELRAS
jgi:peptide/nickel transport system substrate-binding protein